MSRHSPRRPGQVQAEKPAAPPATAVSTSPTAAAQGAAAPAPAHEPALSGGWRVALLVWAASFVLLALFEAVSFAVQVARQVF